MRVLVTGGSGLVGSHFVESYLKNSGNKSFFFPSRNELDITDLESVRRYFKLIIPEVVVHFAAFTDVSASEAQRSDRKGLAWRVNVEGTKNIVDACRRQTTYFIYISTDVVFSGRRDKPGPYTEDDIPEENPEFLSWYGWTKAEAERMVDKELPQGAILRISNPVRSRYDKKLDYVRKILFLYDQGRLPAMFTDQYLTLTYINEVTEVLKILLKRKLPGVYHVSSTNLFTPFELTNLLLEVSRGFKGMVQPASVEEFLKRNPARYPQFGGLRVKKTQKKLGMKFLTWQEIVEKIAKELKQS